MGAGHVLEDGIQNLLLDLSNGVAVEDLHWDLGTVGVVGVDTAQDLVEWREEARGEGSMEVPGMPAAARGPLLKGSHLCGLDWSRVG